MLRRADPLSTLEEGLAQATKGLCPEARSNVMAEIRQHFTCSLQELEERGFPFGSAYRDALKALGSPSVARRELQKVDLTRHEARAANPQLWVIVLAVVLNLWGILRLFQDPSCTME